MQRIRIFFYQLSYKTERAFQHMYEIMKQKKILIVDDNENIRDALVPLLEHEGFKLSIAADGVQALQEARATHPDVLLLDIMIPEIDGYDVCRIIKNDPVLKKVHVIMLTAKGQAREQERGREVGADAYIVKPFSPLEVLTTIKKVTS